MEIEFDEELFNPIYQEFIDSFRDEDVRFIIAFGGSSAAKTYSFVQACITENLENPSNTMILRKWATDIKDTIYSDFENIITDWGLNGTVYNCQINKIINKANGTKFRFRGVDKVEKLKGMVGYKRVVLEEANQFNKEDLDQIRKRLRGVPGQQIILIFNPIDEEHWIKTTRLDCENWTVVPSEITEKKVNDSGNTVVLRTTYLDNKYIVGPYFYDKHCIADFEFDKKHDFDFYRIYALGEWGKLNKGGEFYKKFDYGRHTCKTQYNDHLPLHISFDENVNPYITLTIWQLEGLKATQIDEICLSSPNNRIRDLCRAFEVKYMHHTQGLFIYGDVTSNKEDTKLEKGENFYTLIRKYLLKFKPKIRLQTKNPSVAMRGNFLNEVLDTEFAGCVIRINESCKKTTLDYKYLKEAPDGTKLKEKATDPTTKITYEKYGHCSDANDYFLTSVFSVQYNQYITGGVKTKHAASRKSPIIHRNTF